MSAVVRNRIRAGFYLDSVVHDAQALAYLLEVFGPETVMLGSDYPFPLGEQRPGSALEQLSLSDIDRARIYHGTALEWLGLQVAGFEAAA